VKKLLISAGLLIVIGFAGYWVLTAPFTWTALHPSRDVADAGPPILSNGQAMFYAGSCGTCHASPGQKDETHLGGGLALASAFGTFYMPNISPNPADGIGDWTTAQFVKAMRDGVSNHGANEYPAFPYTSFQRMTANDLRDLFGFIKTLPPVSGKARDNNLKFPFTMRSGVGLWKLVFLDGEKLVPDPAHSQSWNRGRYLVEGPAHCAECHSPRDPLGAIIGDRRFSGGPDPEGHGYVPNITPDDTGIGYWSSREIADYLRTGISPIGLSAGDSMAAIVANMARLSADDRVAMAEYIKTLPAIDSPDLGAPEPNRTAVVEMLPAATTTVQSPTAALSVSVGTVPASEPLYVVAAKPVFLDRANASVTGSGEGKLLPAARLEVVARDGEWLQVKIDGWQQEGSSALYALQGQRILVAALNPSAIARFTRSKTVKDPATGLTWFQGSLTAWVSSADLNPDIHAIWSYSSNLYNASCGTCHSLHATSDYLANQWIGSLQAMKRFTALDDGQYRLLLAYLQLHSKDVGPREIGANDAGAPATAKKL
jgi:mono/diheme cytochrome c family protein